MSATCHATAALRGMVAAAGRLVARAARAARSPWAALAAARRRAAARREFAGLDPAALRDLGVGAGEFDSCWAEAFGTAPCTRRRLAQPVRPGARS